MMKRGVYDEGWSDLAVVVRRKYNMRLVRDIIARGDDVNIGNIQYGRTPLHIAANRKMFAYVEYLIEHGATVDAQDSDGHTPLWDALAAESPKCAKIL